MASNQKHKRSCSFSICFLLACSGLLTVHSSPLHGQMISAQTSLERSGLTSLWFTSAELGAGGKIVDWALDINPSKATTFIRISAGTHREVISENDLDGFGKPFGLDGLVEYAEFRKGVLEAELATRKRTEKVELHQYTLPKSSIFILGSNSRITSIDADSGRQNWSVAFGSLNQPNIGIHADDFYVAAINGTTVYCFDAETGKAMWSHHCKTAVATSPVVAQGKIFVPLLDGRLEIFEIENEGFGSHAIIASGVPTSRPLVTSRVVAWSTDIGHLNFTGVSGKFSRSLIYRLKADGYIESTPTYRDNLVVTGCADGFVYAIEEDTGKMQWQISLGVSISQSPFVFGDCVYAITNDRRMFCMDAKTGEMRWNQPMTGIGKYLGASRDRIYLTDGFRALLVVEPISGTLLSSADVGQINFILPNRDTDRLYVATNTGIVHCVHEIGSPIPYFHPDKIEEIAAAKRKNANPKDTRTESEDPFAMDDENDEDDPFATEVDKDDDGATGNVDPDDDDPFR